MCAPSLVPTDNLSKMGKFFNDIMNNVDSRYVLNSDNISQVLSYVLINSKHIRIKSSSDDLSTCGECVRKIVKNAHFIICNNCELDFHAKCNNNNNNTVPNAHCNTWFSNNCFSKVSNDGLAFRKTLIDFSFTISNGFRITHPYADHILITKGSTGSSIFFDITFSSPRAQPEVVYFLISNESPYFSDCKSKISASNSL